MHTEIRKKFNEALHLLESEGIRLVIRSEDRDPHHNATVGGAKNSQHMHGTAMDFAIGHLTNAQKERALEVFREVGAKGFGIYTRNGKSTGALHVDFRNGPAAIWGKNGSFSGASGHWMPEWAEAALSGLKNSTSSPSVANSKKKQRTEQSTGSSEESSDEPDTQQNVTQNEKMDPLSALLMAIIQMIFGSSEPAADQSKIANNSNLGNLESPQTPNTKSGQKSLG
jgi:hypothetical protein